MVNKDDLPEIYETGTGKIKIRGKVEVEDMKGGKKRLVITEIPYTMIGAGIGKFLNDVCNLVETKKTTDIVDISNQSSKEGIRIVIDLKKGADVENLTNMLYKKTRLEDTFGVNMLAVADGRPETMGLKRIIEAHVDFQFDMATRKYKTLLKKEQDKKEIQEGLIKACDPNGNSFGFPAISKSAICPAKSAKEDNFLYSSIKGRTGATPTASRFS